uniref:Uncharacterized protein n=1 Tax=Arundo donax TaxID=35708 RepID=A0A0A8ZGU7_ARUDO
MNALLQTRLLSFT